MNLAPWLPQNMAVFEIVQRVDGPEEDIQT